MKRVNQDIYAIIFCVYTLTFAALITIYARHPLSIDDVWQFFNIKNRQWVPLSFVPEYGRFIVSAGIDINALMLISRDPYVFFGFNALCACFVLCTAFYLLKQFEVDSKISLLICVFASLNPGFVQVFNGICFPEKMQIVFTSVFLIFVHKIFFQGKLTRLNFVMGILFANLMIYAKEPTFIFFLAFGGYVILVRLISKRRCFDFVGKFCVASIGFSLIYVGLYVAIILPHSTWDANLKYFDSEYMNNTKDAVLKVISSFFNHPVLYIGFFVFVFHRIMVIKEAPPPPPTSYWGAGMLEKIRREYRDERKLYLDSMLCASLLMMLGFIKIKALGFYYFSTMYFLTMIPFGVLSTQIEYTKYYRAGFILCTTLYLVGSLPFALSTFTQTKGFPVAYEKATRFLGDYIVKNPNVVIFMDGRARDENGFGSYVRLVTFLENNELEKQNRGYNGRGYHLFASPEWQSRLRYDLKTSEPNPRFVQQAKNPNSRFTIDNSTSVDTPKGGDLIYVDADSAQFVNVEYLRDMERKHELIFESSYFGVPNLNIKAIIKYVYHKTLGTDIYNRYGFSSNFFRMPLGIYIYRVKNIQKDIVE